MPKSKHRRKRKTPASAKPPAPARARWRWPAILAAAALVAAAGGGWWWQQSRDAEAAFLAHAERGKPRLAELVDRPADEGSGHVAPGGRVDYRGDPPTSGPHDPDWVDPGVYETRRRPEKLVHSLEHGMIVVYYDRPPAEVMETLEDWASLYFSPWSGVVVAPDPGLGEAVVLTAWRRVLRLEPFDADAAAAFIDLYRGRGPEKPVR